MSQHPRIDAFSPRLRPGLAAALLAAGAAGCGGDPAEPPPETPDPAPFRADNAYPEDHPLAAGQWMFLWETWGTEVLGEWPPAEFLLALMREEPEVFGNQFESFGFVADPADEFPVGFKRGLADPARVKETCALCHVAPLPDGRVWMGAPNARLDFGRFRAEVNDRWVAAGNPSLLTPLAEQKLRGLGPGRASAESAEYPDLVAADFPPYFNLGFRKRMNYLGTGWNVRTEAYLALYAFGCGNPNDETAVVPFPPEDRVEAFVAFLGAMEAPAPPPGGDPALVAAGEAVFAAASCNACHHVAPEAQKDDNVVTVDTAPDGMERLPGDDPAFLRGSIRTDRLHLVLLEGGGGSGEDQGLQDILDFIVDHGLNVGPTDGYRTSNVRGLWATAPYLHNGSVPTLEDLLRPQAQRPALWQNGGFSFDVSVPGDSNEGHEFGTDLSEADKTALIAYLKSL